MLCPILVSSFLAAAPCQEPQHSPLDPDAFGVVYDVPATARVRVQKNVVYQKTPARELAIDVYTPPDAAQGAKLPAVVFLNAIGDRLPDRLKEWGIYSSWPRLVAAHGLVGISMDCDGEAVQQSLAALFGFLEREGARLGVDASRLGTYAASANCGQGATYLMSAGCAPGIRAAAFFYGWPEAEILRRDLPVLCIIAEGDATRQGEFYERLWPRVMAQRAPWTLLYGSTLPHAFDGFSDNDASRRVIQQALAFWKSQLEPVPQPPWKPSPERAIIESTFSGDDARFKTLIDAWIVAHPDVAEGYARRGMQLARLRRSTEGKGDLEQALALGSQEPGVKGCLGMMLAAENQHARAVELMQAAIDGGWYGSEMLGTLGHSLLILGRNEEAVRSYERSIVLGIPPGPNTLGLAHYNLACGYARLGRIPDALSSVEHAIEQHFGSRATYEGDSDFAPLREEERFLVALDRLSAPR